MNLGRNPLSYRKQGRDWRANGGPRNACIYRRGTPERTLWEKGWDEENEQRTQPYNRENEGDNGGGNMGVSRKG